MRKGLSFRFLQEIRRRDSLSADSGRLRAVTTAKRAGPATPLRRKPATQPKGYPRQTTLQLRGPCSGAQNPLPERLRAEFRSPHPASKTAPEGADRESSARAPT